MRRIEPVAQGAFSNLVVSCEPAEETIINNIQYLTSYVLEYVSFCPNPTG